MILLDGYAPTAPPPDTAATGAAQVFSQEIEFWIPFLAALVVVGLVARWVGRSRG